MVIDDNKMNIINDNPNQRFRNTNKTINGVIRKNCISTPEYHEWLIH